VCRFVGETRKCTATWRWAIGGCLGVRGVIVVVLGGRDLLELVGG
jgi:hypothetical protein